MRKTNSILALLISACLLAGCFGCGIAAAAGQPHRHAEHKHQHKKKNRAAAVYWGAWIGDQLTGGEAPWDMSAVSAF